MFLTLVACALVVSAQATDPSELPRGHVLSLWRVPYEAQVALRGVNNNKQDDVNTAVFAEPLNDTVQSQLSAMGMTERQQRWAAKYHQLMPALTDGAVLGLHECHRRFKDDRWNCPIHKPDFFEKVFQMGGKESAFVYGIQAAGISLAFARTCALGYAHGVCGCDQKWRSGGQSGIQPNASWSWGACSDNMHTAYNHTLDFLHAGANRNSPTEQEAMANHNYKMGLEVAMNKMQFLCKCHGLTGSCVHRTCWFSVSKIQIIGRAMRKRFVKAVKAVVGSKQLVQALPAQKFTSATMGYVRSSPSYCARNVNMGSLGTQGRECGHRNTPLVLEKCQELCCQRGSRTRRFIESHQCKCQFEWCCRVRCQTCQKAEETYRCA